MLRKYLLPILAVLGVLFAVRTVILGNRPPVMAKPVAQPAKATFGSYVAGSGIVEASTENIAIGTPVGNVVTEVYVKVGDRVRKGDPLFRLRDNVTSAVLESKKAAVAASKARLAKLESMPRPEDIPPAKARVAEATSNLEDLRDQLKKWESVQDKRAAAQEDLDRKRFAVRAAEARLATAESELQLLLAGAWKADIAIAQAELKQAEASVGETEAEIERRTIKAPVDATVLQVKVRPGEYAQ